MIRFSAVAPIAGIVLLVVANLYPAPAPAAAPMTVKSAQQELLRLAAPRYELYDQDVPKGVFMSQHIAFPTACSMTSTRRWPAHRYGGQDYSAGADVFETYHFEQGYSFSSKYAAAVLIAAAPRTGRTVKSYMAKSAADAKRAKEVFEWLGANCKGAGDRTGHSVIDKAMSCKLVAMPRLDILDGGVLSFAYRLHPSGTYSATYHIAFFHQADPRQAHFAQYKASPQFIIPKADAPKNAARYIFYVDGQEEMSPLQIIANGAVTVVSPRHWSGQLALYRAMAKGKKLTVRAFDSKPSQVGIWTYDITEMGKVESTVKSLVRRC